VAAQDRTRQKIDEANAPATFIQVSAKGPRLSAREHSLFRQNAQNSRRKAPAAIMWKLPDDRVWDAFLAALGVIAIVVIVVDLPKRVNTARAIGGNALSSNAVGK